MVDIMKLTEIIDTAESVVGNLLVKWNAPIDKHYSENATLSTLHTTKPHKFYKTQTVAIEGVEAHINGNKCATQTGKVRAQQLAKGEGISLETIKRMHSYLSRAIPT